MKRITASVEDEHLDIIAEEKESADDDVSDAEAIRRLITRASEVKNLEAQAQQLRDERDEAEQRCDELRNRLAAANQRIDASNELVEYVREEQSLEKRKATAGVFTRAKWWLTGMPTEDGDGEPP